MTPWFMLIYPTHTYNPIILKVALTELNYYWFSTADTTGLSSAENKTFCCWAEKWLYRHPSLLNIFMICEHIMICELSVR